MRTIYLDYNATTPVAPSVLEAMEPFFVRRYGNPSSGHALGRACQEAVEDARGHVASLLGAAIDEIIFTSGGTESNNLALKGVLMHPDKRTRGHVVISSIEHPAIVEPARFLTRLGYELTVVPCDPHGVVSPEAVATALRPDTALVSIMHANNEIGTIQPIAEIAELCHRRGVLVHTDAAQTVGRISTRVDHLGVDLLSLAGHKMYAPKGCGALYVRHGTALEPFMHGAGQEGGLRAGTENVPYIVALGHAAKLACRSIDESAGRLAQLRDRLQQALCEGVGNDLTINGAAAPRLPTTLSVNFPQVSGSELLARTPELCASTGAACHSSSTTVSPTLAAIGLSPEVARGTVRLSVGWDTAEEEIDLAADLLLAAWEAICV
jgi:cysteine desulfurase